MSNLNLKAVKKALSKRLSADATSLEFRLEDHLFKEQLDFVLDTSRNKVAVCSRRAGKTTACAADLVHTAINNPNTVGLYITLSRNNAKKIIWRELKLLNKTYKLNATENLSELSLTFPNGAMIYLSGAKDSNEIEKFRGMAIKLAYIDEAQSFRSYIKELISDVLSPALMDYSGTLNLIGTPGPIPSGFFYECFKTSLSWAKHHWTFFNNPFITKKSKITHQEMLDHELATRNVGIADPSIQREFFGKFVIDSNSLLIHYNKDLAHYEILPNKKYNYILGIDLGFDDADALAIMAWHPDEPVTYLVEEIVIPQQGITELVKQIEDLQKRYDISKMVIDQGGLGKKIAEELRRRHSIPVEAADKARKMENIAFMNDALRTGRLKAKNGSKFAQDSYLVEIDRDKSTPDRVKVSDKYHSDIIDAVLYAFKESPAFAWTPPAPKSKHGTQEWAKQQEEDMFEKITEHMAEQQAAIKRLNNMGFE